jgi:hypothetical protein
MPFYWVFFSLFSQIVFQLFLRAKHNIQDCQIAGCDSACHPVYQQQVMQHVTLRFSLTSCSTTTSYAACNFALRLRAAAII